MTTEHGIPVLPLCLSDAGTRPWIQAALRNLFLKKSKEWGREGLVSCRAGTPRPKIPLEKIQLMLGLSSKKG